jgi:hypothetical protein
MYRSHDQLFLSLVELLFMPGFAEDIAAPSAAPAVNEAAGSTANIAEKAVTATSAVAGLLQV